MVEGLTDPRRNLRRASGEAVENLDNAKTALDVAEKANDAADEPTDLLTGGGKDTAKRAGNRLPRATDDAADAGKAARRLASGGEETAEKGAKRGRDVATGGGGFAEQAGRKAGRKAAESGDALAEQAPTNAPNGLTDAEINRLARKREGSQITPKDLKNAGLSPEDIADIEAKSKQLRPRDRGTNRIIDQIGGSKDHVKNALARVRQSPNDPEAVSELRRAQKQLKERESAKRDIPRGGA